MVCSVVHGRLEHRGGDNRRRWLFRGRGQSSLDMIYTVLYVVHTRRLFQSVWVLSAPGDGSSNLI
jgi:hypothetical protein